MKNKKLVVVLLAFVMAFSVVLSAYIPAIDNSITNSTQLDKASSNFVDVTGQYTRAFDESIFADGVLTTATEMNALTGSGSVTFGDSDEVWVIIELTGESLVEQYNGVRFNNYDSLTNYVRSNEAQVDANSMLVKQNTLIKALDRAGIDIEYKYSYMSILNGFAAKVKYGDIAAIEAYSVVKDVIISERYDMPTEAVVNEVDVYETGIFNSSESPYKGEGMVVAVLDTGIEYSHEVFADKLEGINNRMDLSYVAERLSTLNAYTLAEGNLTAEDVYYSAKIPFSYDYADRDTNAVPSVNNHGVHVSGIITGKSETITGVAPKAQVLGMKVFSDYHDGAYTVDIMAALEDCILLNVDVINMSLGSDCGFQTVPEGNRIGELYDQLRTAGITMMVAAGNSNNAASGSAFGSTALTQNPDYGLVSSPASYSTTTTVASINGQKDEYISANDGETIAFFDNASNAAGREYDFYEMLDKKLQANPDLPQFVNGQVTLDYITIPGLGYLYDYAGIDVTNKVVLVARGVCTFQEKALAANTVGALAIIVYNNTTGLIRMSIGNALNIPACSINKDVGDEMSKHATGTITLDKNNLAGPFISNFSSWGCLPDLTLDPDISGHGGNILSSVTGNQYAVQSGTSMATPNLAGVALLLRQYLHETRPELSKADITGLCNQILMSTATIAKDENNKPVSPRKQGSGLAYLEAALNTQAYLTVDGSEFTKLSLGDDPQKTGVYELNFNLVNWGTQALSYEFDIDVMSECFSWVKDYEKWAIEEEAYIFEDSGIKFEVVNGTFANNVITVNGGQVAKITVTVTLSGEAKAYLNQVDENGEII
ncbi:MAG: S8 family serine peptidase, partial [Clostridia bacterium]|nr:S8 family serine peptidase [Clostridia bacterium]